MTIGRTAKDYAARYQNPEDIKAYGVKLNEFSEAIKNLDAALEAIGLSVTQRLPLTGKGKYNSIVGQGEKGNFGTVLYGKEAQDKAARKPSGLFKAFVSLHQPESGLAKALPSLMGKAGFRLRYVKDGAEHFIPLDQLEIGMIPLKYEENGNLIPPIITIKGGEFSSPLPFFSGGGFRGTSLCENEGVSALSVVDAEGKEVALDGVQKVLWGHYSGTHGFKRFGSGTPEFQSIGYFGTDDDFTAERAMIESLTELKNNHGFDAMPHFRKLVNGVMTSLQADTAFMDCLASAIALQKTLFLVEKEGEVHLMKGNTNDYDITNAAASLKKCADFFGLDLSAATPSWRDANWQEAKLNECSSLQKLEEMIGIKAAKAARKSIESAMRGSSIIKMLGITEPEFSDYLPRHFGVNATLVADLLKAGHLGHFAGDVLASFQPELDRSRPIVCERVAEMIDRLTEKDRQREKRSQNKTELSYSQHIVPAKAILAILVHGAQGFSSQDLQTIDKGLEGLEKTFATAILKNSNTPETHAVTKQKIAHQFLPMVSDLREVLSKAGYEPKAFDAFFRTPLTEQQRQEFFALGLSVRDTETLVLARSSAQSEQPAFKIQGGALMGSAASAPLHHAAGAVR